MGVMDAPQWLLPAYVRSVRALGASAPVEAIGESGKALIEMWSSPDRHFHNLKHAINMLARVDELADESHDPDVMRLAAWYHGCVFSSAKEQTYRRNGGEDEVASAAYAAGDLHRLGLPDATVDRICALILSLKRHSLPPNDIDALALNDADLGALAVEPQQYKRYRQLVRQEYAHIPVEDYLRARLTIITRLLDREMLFSSPLGQRWERAARQNLQAEKQRLTDELARTCPVDGDDAADSGAGSEALAGEGARRAGSRTAQGDRARGSRSSSHSPVPFPASTSPRRSPASATSPRTPADGVEVAAGIPPSFPPRRRPRPPARRDAEQPRRDAEHLGHTTMESCAVDLDRLMSSPRLLAGTGNQPVDRAALVEAERAKLAERLRLRTEAAKALRETRTGEIAPITAPLADDGAGSL